MIVFSSAIWKPYNALIAMIYAIEIELKQKYEIFHTDLSVDFVEIFFYYQIFPFVPHTLFNFHKFNCLISLDESQFLWLYTIGEHSKFWSKFDKNFAKETEKGLKKWFTCYNGITGTRKKSWRKF